MVVVITLAIAYAPRMPGLQEPPFTSCTVINGQAQVLKLLRTMIKTVQSALALNSSNNLVGNQAHRLTMSRLLFDSHQDERFVLHRMTTLDETLRDLIITNTRNLALIAAYYVPVTVFGEMLQLLLTKITSTVPDLKFHGPVIGLDLQLVLLDGISVTCDELQFVRCLLNLIDPTVVHNYRAKATEFVLRHRFRLHYFEPTI